VYITVGASKLVFTFLSFYAFQGKTADAVSLNIQVYSVRTLVSVSIVIDKLVTTPLFLYSPRLQLEAMLPMPKSKLAKEVLRVGVSIFLLAVCVVLAMAIPNFAIFSSFVGSVFGMIFIFILPVVFWFRLTKKKSRLDIVLGLWIILTSLASVVGGFYQNLLVILKELHGSNKS